MLPGVAVLHYPDIQMSVNPFRRGGGLLNARLGKKKNRRAQEEKKRQLQRPMLPPYGEQTLP